MSLLSLEQVVPLLACPVCRSPLRPGEERFLCSNEECPFSGPKRFPVVGTHPALVNFDRSILEESATVSSGGGSQLNRENYSGFKNTLRDVIFPPSPVSYRNAERFHRLMKENNPEPVLLMVGGGTRGAGTERLYDDPSIRIIGFDIYGSPLTQFIADGHQIPLQDQSVDAVWVQAVLEHVLDPWQVVREIHRVLKQDGLVYAETPFMQQVHEGAYDFTRFTESGHRWMFRQFESIDSGAVTGPGVQLTWTVEHFSRSLTRSWTVGKLMKVLFFGFNYVDRLCPEGYKVDSGSGSYFLGRKTGRELSPKEIVACYKGAQGKR